MANDHNALGQTLRQTQMCFMDLLCPRYSYLTMLESEVADFMCEKEALCFRNYEAQTRKKGSN